MGKHDDEGRTRGLAVHGGWVSIVTDGGSQYLERIGNSTMQDLAGQFRMIQPYHPAPIYAAPDVNTKRQGQIPAGSDFELTMFILMRMERCLDNSPQAVGQFCIRHLWAWSAKRKSIT